MDLRNLDIPKFDDGKTFEVFTKDLLQANTEFTNVNLHGRPGQKQDGVDVYARKNDDNSWIGIQCKVRSTDSAFTKKELLEEVNKAKSFNPSLKEYYLYTTLSRDYTTQNFVRDICDELAKESSFSFEVLFWDDIQELLKEEQNEQVYYRYYHKYFRDNLAIGHSIGKLLNLGLQFDNRSDSHYELILGKIPKNNDDGRSVDYYRGTYYLVNLHEKRIEFFNKAHDSDKASCHMSDLAAAISNEIDLYRINEWVNSIENLDDFIYNDESNYKFSITSEERRKYQEEN